jgi:hypothetical protein
MWEQWPLRIILPPLVGGRRKTMDDGDTPGLTGTFSRQLLRVSGLKKGDAGAVGEK